MAPIFKPIRESDPNAFIGRCTEMLPNRKQCYNGADFVLTDDSAPTTEGRQVCRFHAKLILAEYEQRPPVKADEVKPEHVIDETEKLSEEERAKLKE